MFGSFIAEELGPCSPFSGFICLFNSLILMEIITLAPSCNKKSEKGEIPPLKVILGGAGEIA